MLLKFSSILFIEFFINFQNFPSVAQYCGGKAISSFKKKLKYEPDGDGPPLEVRRRRRHTFAGSNGKVYIGYVRKSAAAQYEGCVAIKIFDENCYEEYVNSKNFMQKMQNDLSPEERKHLIRMIDAGDLKRTKNGMVIMEMGLISLEGRIYRDRKQYENDMNLFAEIKKIVEPVKELHKVAVHGDIKPANFVYVNETRAEETLKLIDYDGASFLPGGLFGIGRKMANKAVQRPYFVVTPKYASPEYYADQTVTTKMDIWALGIIAYEVILLQPTFNERISNDKMTQTLLRIGDIYMGIKRDSYGLKETDECLYENPLWIRNHFESLMRILHVWQTYPKTALLIANLLHPAKEVRMSAIGVQNFLDGWCLIAELKTAQNAAQLNFVHRFTFGAFFKMVEQRMNAVCCASCNCTAAPVYDALLDRIEQVMFSVQRTITELRGGGGILHRLLGSGRTCDTERNG